MEGVRFSDVLKSFEAKTEGENYEGSEKSYDERKIIENDVKRTTFVGIDKNNSKKIKLLKKILFESLNRIPNRYTQGMSEIGSVFVLHYFEDIAARETSDVDKGREDVEHIDVSEENCSGYESAEESSAENDAIASSSDRFIMVSEAERTEFERFISRHQSEFERLVIVLTNVFRRKFEPLVADEFKVYKENIKVFVEMMRKKGVRIPELESHRFMGCIFTFFLRNLSNKKDICRIFEIILSCPNTCPFLLLAIFYREVSNHEMIEEIGDDLFPEVIKYEEEFVETKRRMGEGSGFSVRNALLIGGVASMVTAVVLYRMSKKE